VQFRMSTRPSATFLKSVVRLEDLPEDDKPQIALVGRSNVGKSSLINNLVGVKGLAKTSSTPGLTQALNFFEVNRRYYLVDLPGYGYARKSGERREHFLALITDYLQRSSNLKLVLLVIDARVGLTELDVAMLKFLQKAKLTFLMVINKSDKLGREAQAKLMRTLGAAHAGVDMVLFSTQKNVNRGALIAVIEKALQTRA
jgi:GTP-binding protein